MDIIIAIDNNMIIVMILIIWIFISIVISTSKNNCIQRLHTKISYKDCILRLHRKIAYKDCLDLPSPPNRLLFRIHHGQPTCLVLSRLAPNTWELVTFVWGPRAGIIIILYDDHI